MLVNIYGLIRKNREVQILTLVLYVFLGLFAVLAYSTGDGAEKMMKTYPGFGENLIEPHENQALFFFIGLMATSAFAIAGLYMARIRQELIRKFNVILLIAGLLLGILAYTTGLSGGEIRHSEIEKGYYQE